MATKTNYQTNGKSYYRIRRKIGTRINEHGKELSISKAFYGKSKQEAEQKYHDFMARLNNTASSESFEQVFSYWLEHYFSRSSLKATSKQRYLDAYNHNMANLPVTRKSLSKIDSQALQELYNQLPCAPSTVHSLHKILSAFYKWACASGTCATNPTATLVLPKVQKRKPTEEDIETWTDNELKTIMELSQGHRLHFLFVILANAGVRISEALGLTYSDFDIDNGLLKIQRQLQNVPIIENAHVVGHEYRATELKTETAVRSVPLQKGVIKAFTEHKNTMIEEAEEKGYKTNFVFTTNKGTPYDVSTLRKTVKRLYNRYGVACRGFHAYRHTYASKLATAGAPIQVVSRLLGHSDVNITARYYINVPDEIKRQAVEQLPPIL